MGLTVLLLRILVQVEIDSKGQDRQGHDGIRDHEHALAAKLVNNKDGESSGKHLVQRDNGSLKPGADVSPGLGEDVLKTRNKPHDQAELMKKQLLLEGRRE